MKRTIPAPAIRIEIPIQSENVSCIQLIGELNQARIGEVRSKIAILAQDIAHGRRGMGELERNLEDSPLDVLKDRISGPGKPTQEVAALCDYRLAGDQWPVKALHHLYATSVLPRASVQQRYNNPGVDKHGLHWPKPRKCFLLEARSGTPEANRPTPTTRLPDGTP